MTTKPVNLRTNYNHKLSCDIFVHLDVAPPERVPQQVLDETIFIINVMDQSHPPVTVKLDDVVRFPMRDLREICTLLSHGMSKQEYFRFTEDKKWQPDTELALYYYRKVKDVA